MARDPGTYSEEIVWEFYASYAATLHGSISRKSKPLAQDPLTSTMVRGCPVDLSQATISRFLYGPTTSHTWSLNTAEFDYRWDIVRSGAFQRNAEQREAVILWLAKYIAADGERAKWVGTPWLGIRKATLNFAAKFFWLLVRNRVSPTKADNQLTWDRAVIVAALVAGVEIDFARMLLEDIHERAFKTSTTYPFSMFDFPIVQGLWSADLGIVIALERPAPAIDLSFFQAELASLWDDVNSILATPTVEPQAAPTALADDTVLHALFSGIAEEESAPTHTKGASSSTPVVEVPLVVRDVVSTTAGVVRVIESTTEGAMMNDVGTNEGDPTIVLVGSKKPDPPAC
uniref:Integrase core domain containing protein n=1 Tax=Solanum tuberosum TaxID=4113 RepID=M1DAY4_SOLTU